MIELRSYQREALDVGIYGYFSESAGNPLVVVPTGGGKSLIIAQFLREIYAQWPDQRVLILTHVKELIQQNYGELISIWPDAPAGVNSAGLGRRDYHSSIIFGGIQSLHKHAYTLQRIDLVIVDEAHLIPRNANTMYRRFLGELAGINPYLKIIGLTATPYRTDSGMLHEGEDALFSDISYEISVRDLIEQGYLAKPDSSVAAAQIDTAGVGTRAGEFIPGQLEGAALVEGLTERICDEIVLRGSGRRGWLVFGCGVDHCIALRDGLRKRGIACESIFGDTPAGERDRIIRAYKAQEVRALASMNVLTTGFNARHVDLLALARPTKSTGLYIQMIGRGLRVFPGKDDCLILDFGGNIARHGPIDQPKVKNKGPSDGEGEAPTKECPECGNHVLIALPACPYCGYEWPLKGPELDDRPAALPILQKIEPEWLDVQGVHYTKHEKPGKPPSLCVHYIARFYTYREWICLEHEGYARQKAVAWWKRRAPEIPVPDTVDEALRYRDQLNRPEQICVKPSGKYHEIIGAKLA